MRRTRGAALVALSATAAMVLAACGGGGGAEDASQGGVYADCDASPTTCNAVPMDQLQDGGTVTMALEKNIANWNMTSSEGNVYEAGQAIKALLPYTFFTTPDLQTVLNEDLLVSAEIANADPQTIEYVIQPDAAWDDGTPITAEDFIYNWKVQNGRDCPECVTAGNGGYDLITSVTGSPDGKTVTVVYSQPYTDWQGIWNSAAPMYPAHIAAEQGDLNTPEGLAAAFAYFSSTVPDYSGGPFRVASWENDVALTLEPNPAWYGAVSSPLDQVIFRIITDATQEPLALQNNEVQAIQPQPQVDLVQQLANIPGVSQHQGLGLTWEHFDLQLQNPFLADEAIRDAMFTAVDTQDLIDKTVGQFNDQVTPLGSLMYLQNMDGYVDQVSPTGQGSGDVDRARTILTDAGYTNAAEGQQLTTPDGQVVPTLRIRYSTGNAIRQTQSELFAAYVAPLGISVEVVPTDDLGGTLESGDYDVVVFAWQQSPFPFGSAQQLWLSTSGSNYGRYANAEVDRLINEAAGNLDPASAREQLNQAGEIVTEDAYVLPLYQKPTLVSVRNEVANLRNNSSLDGPTYNIQEWGLRTG